MIQYRSGDGVHTETGLFDSMKFLSRVVWSEGMYLGPQQFQAQNRYFEESLQFASNSLNYRPYGLSGCMLDADALRNGTVALVHARGLFADGLPFHMPEADPIPPARPIADLFPPTRESLTVRLAVPERRSSGINCATNGAPSDSRYLMEIRNFIDESTGTDERPVQIGRKRLRLVFDTEPHDGLTSIAVARVIRDGAGHYVYDPEFIPPCLEFSASERLLVLVRQLIEILEQKSATLSGGSKVKPNEYSTRDLAAFWLLHSVNSGIAVLRHLWTSKRGHPEELFLELSRLAGALCTFSLDSHPRTLPLYDHDEPGSVSPRWTPTSATTSRSSCRPTASRSAWRKRLISSTRVRSPMRAAWAAPDGFSAFIRTPARRK